MYTPHGCGPSAARAVSDVPSAIAATRLTNAHAKSEQLAMLLTSFVFIVVVSFSLSFFLFWPSLASHREKSCLAVHSGTP
jgi:H+/gluconate symporter-like permease